MGLMAGPERPPKPAPIRGRRARASIARLMKVFTSERASAPCSSAARAGGSMALTLGESLTISGRVATRPLIVKLSPNVSAIEPPARAAEEHGADALSLVNTFISLAIDARARRPRIGAGFGGLSGPAIKPIALRLVYQAARAVKIPVIGLGGIASGEDAAEFLIAGASAVAVGTATFWDPRSPLRIAGELGEFLRRENIAAAADLVGTLKM